MFQRESIGLGQPLWHTSPMLITAVPAAIQSLAILVDLGLKTGQTCVSKVYYQTRHSGGQALSVHWGYL